MYSRWFLPVCFFYLHGVGAVTFIRKPEEDLRLPFFPALHFALYLLRYLLREKQLPDRFHLGEMSSGLGNFEGILQTDGYAAYDHVGGPEMVYAACWAHARRKFFQAAELNPKDQVPLVLLRRLMSFLTLISGRVNKD